MSQARGATQSLSRRTDLAALKTDNPHETLSGFEIPAFLGIDMTRSMKTIKGSCHCGLIQYTCNAPISTSSGALSATRCNCTFCQKFCSANLRLERGAADFKLLSPSTKDFDDIEVYASKGKATQRMFCESCGVHVWMEGFCEHEGQKHELFIVNLPTVDQPQDGVDLSLTKIAYWDGLRDDFRAGREDGPFPNGLI